MPVKPGPRCAIYTRKSSEEGLEQDFNSLDAQREACAAYIASQKHEGWVLIETAYDDGGLSGATLDRPALQRLLDDIEKGKIEVVLVYKVDRLTRSLADFAKIVEVFDRQRVSFVSITQQFNTTSSMGRLTLNMLLSFAQFEREVTGERIRDKIAASKKKGMWMGGFVPLGYDAVERSLVINEAEAETVRTIYRLYAELGCVRRVQEETDRLGLRTKIRTRADGSQGGGRPLGRGHIYRILKNPIYIGRIAHKDQIYDGRHPAIIDPVTWDQVQEGLERNGQARVNGSHATDPSLLTGLLYDDRGNRMSPSHAVKHGTRYRYYVSQALLQHREAGAITRLAAAEIESLVDHRMRAFLKDAVDLLDGLGFGDMAPGGQHRLITSAKNFADRTPGDEDWRVFLRSTIKRITIAPGEISIALSKRELAGRLMGKDQTGGRAQDNLTDIDPDDPLILTLTAQLKRCGSELRFVVPAGGEGELPPRPNAALIKATARAHLWKEKLLSGDVASIRVLAQEESLPERYVSRILRLAFLAPDIVEAILDGHQPPDLDLDRLMKGVPLSWDQQRLVLGFATR